MRLRKHLSMIMGLGLASILAACGGPSATTAAPQPTIAPATGVDTQAPTPAAPDATPGGGLPTTGGGTGPEAITADNINRLGSLYNIPVESFTLAMSFSPDGKMLAVGTAKGGVVFDVESQGQVASFAPSTPLAGVVWSPDSKLVVGVPGPLTNAPLSVWDVTANAESSLLSGKLAGQTAMGFSPDGTQAATGDSKGAVTVWNLSSGDPVAGFNVSEGGASSGHTAVSSIAFTGDGATLIVSSTDGATTEVVLWDLAASKALPKPVAGSHVGGSAGSALFAPGDTSKAYWWAQDKVVVVDIATDQEIGQLDTEDIIQSVAFSPDGKVLAVGSAGTQDGVLGPLVKLWNTETGQDLRVLTGLPQIPTALAFSADGSKLAMAIGSQGVAIWGLVQNQ